MQCKTKASDIGRPLANFEPNIWGDLFFSYTPSNEVIQRQKEEESKELKELVRKRFMYDLKDPKELLEHLDAIHRLGVAYHFDSEIEDSLTNFYKKLHADDCYEEDLYYVSLRFRLLRQHGFYVSCDVFSKFKDEDGSFKDCLASDVQGILCLYEASYLGLHGENLLDNALEFCTACLTSIATDTQLSSHMAEQIAHALTLPLHRRNIRLESRYQISFYESKSSHDKTLLRFAKLDFNLLQELHKMELRDYTSDQLLMATHQFENPGSATAYHVFVMGSRWARDLNSIIKLPDFARDRVVEGYYWTLGAYYEPKYSRVRMWANKLFKIISIIDDMYDAYGTTEELEPFTLAMQRWDKTCINDIPEYMKLFYQATLDTFDEIEQVLAKEGQSYAIQYTRQQLTATCQCYLQEAKWRFEKIVPTYDDSFKNGIVSSGYLYINCIHFLGLGKIVTKDAYEWINENSKAPRASCILTRLLDDIAGHKFERQREHVASTVECYMKQFGNLEEETYKEIHQVRIEEAWKDINEELLGPIIVPKPFINQVINLSRVSQDLLHIGEDGYTHPKYMKSKVIAVLIDPIIM